MSEEKYDHRKTKDKGKMRDQYTIDNLIGKGAYGEVRRCIWKKDMHDKKTTIKQYRAVKILSKAYMEEKHINEFYNEIVVHQEISEHPCIMTLHHWFED